VTNKDEKPTFLIPTQQLKEAAGKAVMEEIGGLIFRINTSESGRLLETCFQLLPDDAFKTLVYLVIGNETDELARTLMYETAFRIAQKIGIEITNPDQITEAVSIIWMMVNAENLRRKGQMEYLAPNDIYTSTPKHPGFNRLTEAGKEIAYKQILENNEIKDQKFVM
jgi:hypothetical protein